jgi:hypothetical protein
VQFRGTFDSDNRWFIFSSLMPWEELEDTYTPQFNSTTGTPAKPVRLAFGAFDVDPENITSPYESFPTGQAWPGEAP